MSIELRRNIKSSMVFIVCSEKGEELRMVCPDSIVRNVRAYLFEDSFFGEPQELIENGTITEKQFEVYLEELYRQEQTPTPEDFLELGEMTRMQKEDFINTLMKWAAEKKREAIKTKRDQGLSSAPNMEQKDSDGSEG